jgi:hypothetical protein
MDGRKSPFAIKKSVKNPIPLRSLMERLFFHGNGHSSLNQVFPHKSTKGV